MAPRNMYDRGEPGGDGPRRGGGRSRRHGWDHPGWDHNGSEPWGRDRRGGRFDGPGPREGYGDFRHDRWHEEPSESADSFGRAARKLMYAVGAVRRGGDGPAFDAAKTVLDDATRSLYRLLVGEGSTPDGPEDPTRDINV